MDKSNCSAPLHYVADCPQGHASTLLPPSPTLSGGSLIRPTTSDQLLLCSCPRSRRRDSTHYMVQPHTSWYPFRNPSTSSPVRNGAGMRIHVGDFTSSQNPKTQILARLRRARLHYSRRRGARSSSAGVTRLHLRSRPAQVGRAMARVMTKSKDMMTKAKIHCRATTWRWNWATPMAAERMVRANPMV